jgi:hypothetical protein
VANSAGENRTSRWRFIRLRECGGWRGPSEPACNGKGIAGRNRRGVRSERDEGVQFGAAGLASGEVEFTQCLEDPDIHGEGVLGSVGKQEDAIGDFFAHARQFDQSLAGFRGGQSRQVIEHQGAVGDAGARRQERGGAESHFAIAQVGFGAGGNGLGAGESPARGTSWGGGQGLP